MDILRRFLTTLFWFAMIGVLVTIVVQVSSGSSGDALKFQKPTLRCDHLVSGREYKLHAVLHNQSRQSIRVIGAGSHCGPNGCLSVSGLPVELAPGMHHLLNVQFEPGKPGPFEDTLPIYTNSSFQPYLILRIEGNITER